MSNAPVMVQAQEQPPTPTPEQLISPEQHFAGVIKAYLQLVRTELTYSMFNNMLHQKGSPPLLQYPTGKLGIDGEQIKIELDLTLPFKKNQDEQARAAELQQAFRHHNNYYANEYMLALRQLSLHATNAWKFLAGDVQIQPEQSDFDTLIGRVHAVMPEYFKKWSVLKQIEDGVAHGSADVTLGGAVSVDLSAILSAANVTSPEQQQAIISQTLGGKVAELRQELEPCLRELTAASTMAMHLTAKQGQTT